jgi:hypothetical protein
MVAHDGWFYMGTYDETSHILLMANATLMGGFPPSGPLPPPLQELRTGLDAMDLYTMSMKKRAVVVRLMRAIDARDRTATAYYIEQMLALFGGADLFKSPNGVLRVPVTTNGFENHMNFGFRRLLSVDEDGLQGLVIGTANAFTGHPKGGCEILIGR